MDSSKEKSSRYHLNQPWNFIAESIYENGCMTYPHLALLFATMDAPAKEEKLFSKQKNLCGAYHTAASNWAREKTHNRTAVGNVIAKFQFW